MGTLVVTSKQEQSTQVDSLAIYFAIAAYTMAVLPYMVFGHTALGLLCCALSMWRLHVTYVKAQPPSSDTTTIVSCVAIVILAGLTQLTLSPQSGVIALMVLLGCKNLGARSPAQFTNNLLLLPFLPMGLFLTLDPSWATMYLVLFLWIWLSALLRVWQRQGTVNSTLRQGLRTLGILAPFILLSYFMLPRPQVWWNQQQQEAQTGMSSTLKPGDVGRLSQNQETAFFASFPQGLPMDESNMYWRGLTLSQYKDGEWSARMNDAVLPENWVERTTSQEGSTYHIVFPFKKDNFLYTLEYSTLSNGGMRRDATAVVPEKTNRQLFGSYDATYYPKTVMDVAPSRLESTPLQDDNPNATRLAQELWRQEPEIEKFLTKLRTHIQSKGFEYSLNPGIMKESWIDTFLEQKRGFCEHYAGTVAYMLRQVGVPTRVVAGFQGAKPSTTNTLDIPYSAAHAWLEYWSAASNRWVRLDPTSWVAPERLTAQHWERTDGYKNAWWGKFGFLAMQMESQWKMWVTYYDADQQRALWRKMRDIDWLPLVLGFGGALLIGWLGTGKRWYALSPKPLHQWKWCLRNEHLEPSTTTVAYKQRVPEEFSNVFEWVEHVELAMYANKPSKILDYAVWLKALASMKSIRYVNYKKNLRLHPQTP